MPITFPFSLTKTHFENLTRGINALAGVATSTIGGGGFITIGIIDSRRVFMFDSMIVFANPSSLHIPVNREASKTGILLIEMLLIFFIASLKESFLLTP